MFIGIKKMFKSVDEITDYYGFELDTTKYNSESVLKIFNDNGIIFSSENSKYTYLKGLYYKYVECSYNEMTYNFMQAILLGNSDAKLQLEYFYKDKFPNMTNKKINELIETLKKCFYIRNGIFKYDVGSNMLHFSKAAKLGSTFAIYEIAYYLYRTADNYDKMVRYCFKGINLGDKDCMVLLGNYFAARGSNKKYKYYSMFLNQEGAKLDRINNTNTSSILLIDVCLLIENVTSKMKNQISEIVRNFDFKEEIIHHLNTKFQTTKMNEYLYNKCIIEQLDSEYKPDYELIFIDLNGDMMKYTVHSFILDSDFFRVQIDGNFIKSKTCNLEVSSFKIANVLVEFLYLQKINFRKLSQIDIDELNIIADQYQLDNLTLRIKYYQLFNL